MIKKNITTLIFATLAIALFFVPHVKAFIQQGLTEVGFYHPKVEKENIYTTSCAREDFSFEMIDEKGKTINIGDLRGKVVFINFWATWCEPCIAEMPTIQRLYDKIKSDKDIVLLTVEMEKRYDKVKNIMKKYNLKLPVLYPNSEIPKEFFGGSIPTSIILDRKGNLVHTTVGMVDYSSTEILNFLEELKRIN